MKKKTVSGLMLTLLSIGMLTWAFNIQPVKAEPKTWTVDDDGPADFPTIQEAINSPLIGERDIIYVKEGTYYENVVVNKSVTLRGQNKSTTIIDASRMGTPVKVTSNNVHITDFTITNGAGSIQSPNGALELANVQGCNISNNNILTNEWDGIWLIISSNNTISGNNVTMNDWTGIHLYDSSNNTVEDNVVENNLIGIWLEDSSDNILRGNRMANNTFNFGVVVSLLYPATISDFVNDIDASNSVDGKPIYYWINRRDVAVPLDAGYVALVNCTGITVQSLNLIKNGHSILLAYTIHSAITKNNITNNYSGIAIWASSDNNISGNDIANNWEGIGLIHSSNNSLYGNNVAANSYRGITVRDSSNNKIYDNKIEANSDYGIELSDSSNNKIYGNRITNSWDGIWLLRSSNNMFYHNNFLNNTYHADVETYEPNVWNDGYPSGGNYWSDHVTVDDYSGVNQDEPGSDGIVDAPYTIDDNNRDNYPLAEPWSPVISATIDVGPDTLNLKSKGKWITSYIQLPEGYSAEDIDAATILLIETIAPVLDPKYDFVTNSSEHLTDHDNDGVLERTVKFSRAEMAEYITSVLGVEYGNVNLAITGELYDGTPFQGTCTIKVLSPGDADDDGDVDFDDFTILAGCYGMSIENPSCNPLADFDEDGCINYADFLILAGNYGKEVG